MTDFDKSFARLDHWSDAVKLVPEFWSTGSGLGTYRYIYRLKESQAEEEWFIHAENQFLETLVELGLPGLIVLVAAIVVVFWSVAHLLIFSDCPGHFSLGLAGLFCLVSQIVAGSFDFGLYRPAGMLLMAVLCGIVVAHSGREFRSGREQQSTRSRTRIVQRGFLCMCIVLFLAGSAGYAWEMRLHRPKREIQSLFLQFEEWRFKESELSGEQIDELDRLIDRGLRIAPRDPELHLFLAEVHIHKFRQAAARQVLENNPDVSDSAAAWQLTSLINLHGLLRNLQRANAQEELNKLLTSDSIQQHLVPAWEHLMIARGECPLLTKVHFRLALLDPVVGGDRAEAEHLARVVRTHPQHRDMPYWAGFIALRSGNVEVCLSCWRESLQPPTRHEKEILNLVLANGHLTKRNAAILLPDDSELLLRVAQNYLSGSKQGQLRRHLILRARDAIGLSGRTQGEQHYLLAQIHLALKEYHLAQSNFEAAISLEPQRTKWREEYAEFMQTKESLGK